MCRGSLADVAEEVIEVASKLYVSFIHVLTSANAGADSLARRAWGDWVWLLIWAPCSYLVYPFGGFV